LAASTTAAAAQPLLPEPPGRLWRVQAEASEVRILVFREGAAAAFGHNHVLTAPQLQGWLQLPGLHRGDKRPDAGLSRPQLAGAQWQLWTRLDALQLDAASQREPLGAAFASKPSAEAVAATRANMLGESLFQADRYPLLHLRSQQVAGEGEHLALQMQIQLHGQSRLQWVPVQLTVQEGVLRARGQFVLLQSDFGVTPLRVLGGLLAVQDPLWIAFDLQLREDPP